MKSPLKYSLPASTLARWWYTWRSRSVEQWIFVATTGRSGTLTLVDLFSQVPGCIALHEPYPAMHGRLLEDASYGRGEPVARFYRRRKSVNVRRSAAGARTYLEANHLFIKTFADHAAQDFGQRLRVVHLVRDPAGVAHSIYQLEDQPGTEQGNRWWLDYRAPTNCIPLATELEQDPEFSHPFYKGLWYWFETEARIQHWRERWPAIAVVTFHTEDFSSQAAIRSLFDTLDIPLHDTQLKTMTSIRRHERSHQKKRLPLDTEERLAKLNAFCALLTERGFELPASLQRYVD